MEEEIKRVEELTGRIISKALHIEDYLEFFISNYFIKPQNLKTFFLNNYIIQDLSMEKKIVLFDKICKREKFDKKKTNEALVSIRIVQETRNNFAHQQVIFNPSNKEIHLGNRRKGFLPPLNVQEKFREVEDETSKAIQIIVEFYEKYQKEGTIDERGKA